MYKLQKKLLWIKFLLTLALAVAEILTIACGIAYCQINSINITWHIVASFIVGGFMVAYAAMFGFDKLREVLKWGDSK